MKILLINRFFGGEATPTGRMLLDLALQLQALGHQVEVLSSTATYAGALEAKETGFKVRFVSSPLRGRIFEWGYFWLASAGFLCSRSWDCCLFLTDPPFLPLAAWLTSLFRRRSQKLFWWTMDLYPEALVAAGIIRESSIINRFLRNCNNVGARCLSGIIVLGNRQLELVQEYRDAKGMESLVAPPWDLRSITLHSPGENRLIDTLKLSGKKIALYAGNLGEGQAWKPLLLAAKILKDLQREDWTFVFVIRGVGRSQLTQQMGDLTNVLVLDYLPDKDTSLLLSMATVHLVTMKNGWDGIIVPSKLYGAFQTKAPVLFIGPERADTADEIKRLGRGRALPGEVDGLAVVNALDDLVKHFNDLEPYRDIEAPHRIASFINRIGSEK